MLSISNQQSFSVPYCSAVCIHTQQYVRIIHVFVLTVKSDDDEYSID